MSDTLIGVVSNTQPFKPLTNISERSGDYDELMRRNNDKLSRDIRVAMPAKIVSFDSTKQTIVAQPLIREKIINRQTGEVKFMDLPQLLDVPVHFPQGGNFVLTFPMVVGDEVLIIFNDMCIDSWWESGGVQNWNDRRRHDLSDAMAIPGINSVPRVIGNISTTATELRSKDNSTKISVASNTVTITATTINLNGDVKHNGKDYMAHLHSGVQTGSGTSGGVVEP